MQRTSCATQRSGGTIEGSASAPLFAGERAPARRGSNGGVIVKRSFRAAVLAGAIAASFVIPLAQAEAAPAAPVCKVADASLAMNPIPASADCAPTTTHRPLATAALAAAAASLPAGSTAIHGAVPFDTTNGDILAITKINGAASNLIAFGGNFTAVITPNGVSHPATNLAVVNESTGDLVYAGNANSYVRALSSGNGVLYVGGDFTTIAGVARNHLAALSSTFAVSSWNPAPGSRVRAVAAGALGVYYGGDGGSVKMANFTSGAAIWSQPISGGAVKAITITPDGSDIFVGGLFEFYGTLSQHGLIKAVASTGAPITAFNAHLKTDSNVGPYGSYDGEEAIAFAMPADGSRLVTGIGGHGEDEIKIFDPTTGALIWGKVLIGDGQAVGVVGTTYVVGYHRNNPNNVYPYPYFAAQLEASNAQLTNWDPGLTGDQSNADGGNNGVQAIYVDQAAKELFVAGAFTTVFGAPHKSLIAYTFG